MGQQWKVSKATPFQARKLSQNSGQVSESNFATVAFLQFKEGRLRRELERKGIFLSGEYCDETLL